MVPQPWKDTEMRNCEIGILSSCVPIASSSGLYTDSRITIHDSRCAAHILILCSEKNSAVVKYSILSENKQLFASKYKLLLPTEEQLAEQIRKDRNQIENGLHLVQDEC